VEAEVVVEAEPALVAEVVLVAEPEQGQELAQGPEQPWELERVQEQRPWERAAMAVEEEPCRAP
jgi:hypothetical protein